MATYIVNIDLEDAIEKVLYALDIDLKDENFKDTPKRVAKAFQEILRYQHTGDLKTHLESILIKSFPTEYKGIVAQKAIKAISMCPHHMQPIQYEVDIGYIADRKALGLSKIVRIVTALASRMVLQETFTEDIASVFHDELQTEGVIVIVRGKHGCMTNRGVKQDVITTTSSIRGIFEDDIALRQEFLTLNQ